MKTYVVGTQKKRLNETVLLSTQNKSWNWWIRKYLQAYTETFFFHQSGNMDEHMKFRCLSHIQTSMHSYSVVLQ